jgi:hypothetical protein
MVVSRSDRTIGGDGNTTTRTTTRNLLLLFIGLGACQQPNPETLLETLCPEAEDRLGRQVCVHEVPDGGTWSAITYSASAVDQARATTYLIPARDDSRLAPLFVDAAGFEMPKQSLHFQFLTQSFEEFELLEYAQYVELINDPELREWYAGSVTEFLVPGEASVFGFTVYDQPELVGGTITCNQVQGVYNTMNARFEAGTVAVVPLHQGQRDLLADCDVPSYDPSTALDYEPYTKAKGCGTLRRFTLTELAAAETSASFGWQDVLVIDEAPLDIETIISGVVTGTRQGELSHLNVRSASRGTPNCYVKDGYALLADWEGQLVELECGPTEATVEAITPEQAEQCWEDLRPDPVEVVPPDFEWTEFVGLLEVPTQTVDERRAGVGRFGSKGLNLGTLYQRIDPDLQLEGFLIPLHYYDAFVNANAWEVDLGAGLETLTFAETINRFLDDSTFTSDGAYRRAKLLAMQAAMRESPCDPTLVDALGTEILDVYGSDDVMVRFRSSSNAEDALGFNGAGLYDSTSVCLADETDGDVDGPSHCDADKSNERDVCRGLTKVWASLWNYKAYEEREWYSIDHRQVGMGILVNTRTKGELANIVAFTGNPTLAGDDRYLINAQLGELDVVSALPGVWPEKDLLTLEDGAVTDIERARGSTELPEGEWVLDDARVEELGAALWDIVEVYPVDEEVPPTADVLLDTEWKLRNDGRLAIKQVRPFLD